MIQFRHQGFAIMDEWFNTSPILQQLELTRKVSCNRGCNTYNLPHNIQGHSKKVHDFKRLLQEFEKQYCIKMNTVGKQTSGVFE